MPSASSGAASAIASSSGSSQARVRLGEVVEDVDGHHLLDAGMADADAEPPEAVADRRRDRAETIVAGRAAAGLHADLAGRQVDLVMDDDDVLGLDLVEARRLADRAARTRS